MAQTNSIGDVLGMDFDDEADDLPFDFGDEGEDYDQWTRYERSIAFDLVWDHLGTYPEDIDDPVVDAILDDTDHHYRITYEDQERETAVTGLALFAWMDDEAEVEVIEDGS